MCPGDVTARKAHPRRAAGMAAKLPTWDCIPIVRRLECLATAGEATAVRPKSSLSKPRGQRTDEVRKLIGATLLALLVLMVVMGFAALYLIALQQAGIERHVADAVRGGENAERLAAAMKIANDQAEANAERLATLLNIVFGPVVTLLGSVTGFYFGSRSTQGRL
jgi:hypothetical protein